MKILIDIWNFLITENEFNTKISYLPLGCLLEAYLIFMIITTLLKINHTSRQKYVYIFLMTFFSFMISFFIPSPFNAICNYIITFLIIKVVLKTNLLKSALSTILPTIIFALIGALIMNPFLRIFSVSYHQVEITPLYRILYISTIYLLVFAIIALVKYNTLNTIFTDDFFQNNKKIIILNLSLAFLTLIIQLITTFYYINTYSIFFTFINFLSLLAYFIASFYSLARTMQLQIASNNLETAENYNTTLTVLYDNVKSFKHDFDNMVYTIGGYINTNDLDGLKKYYKELEKDCINVNNISILNPSVINNSGIYNLLMTKYKKSIDLGIDFNLEFFFDLSKLKMPIYYFSRMLGILIDNAIEAASETDNKKINILFRDSSSKNTQIINIENTYINKNIDKKQIFKKGISTKENHTGMGLWEVNQILKKNNNVNLITDNDDNFFKQHIEIYY